MIRCRLLVGFCERRMFVGWKVTPLKKARFGDCGNVTTDDNEDVTPVIAPEKAVESGSSWIDYIGPLTSDEIDSDKRWCYRDPNGNIHGLFSLAQLRSWKDYFPRRSSDLELLWQR
ncbi:zinc finger CCCH domain-containing protein 19 [Tanacetum coccineum]